MWDVCGISRGGISRGGISGGGISGMEGFVRINMAYQIYCSICFW